MALPNAALIKQVQAHTLFLAGYPPTTVARERDYALTQLRYMYGAVLEWEHWLRTERADLEKVCVRLQEFLEDK